MTRIEALHIFQLTDESTDAQIELVYQDRFNNLHQQLRNSPTDALRIVYQNNLKALEDAYQMLKTMNVENFPSVRPIATNELNMTHSTQISNADNNESIPASSRLTKQLEDLKKQKTYFLVVLIGLASVLSYFVVQYFDLKAMKPKAEKFDVIEKKLLNRKFVLKNSGQKTYQIIAYNVTYLDDEGNLAEMEEGMKGENYSFIFEPGKTFTVTKVVGKNIVFDGKALSYTIILCETGVANAVPKVFSGLFNTVNETPLNPD
jgi:hypothetical protein